MFDKVHIVRKLNAKDDRAVRGVVDTIEIVANNPPSYHQSDRRAQIVQEPDENTLVIAVGGDGTMLEAMRVAQKVNATATGINLGKVGFLTDFPKDSNLGDALWTMIHQTVHPVEERIALELKIIDKGNPTEWHPVRPAFNEFVISNKLSDHLIKYTLFIGDRCAGVHRANALIIGTPTGSTAYSLSAGGGLLLPSMEAMQIIPVAPISMTSRPIIIPAHEEVRVSIETEGEWILKADGSTLVTLKNDMYIDSQVVISQSKNKVKILHSKHWSYFDMLTQKLGWKSN